MAIFLPLTHQKPEEAGEATNEGTVRLLVTAAEGAMGGVEAAQEESGRVDITTTKLLGILACLSLFTLLWEQFTCLDGPNAAHEMAHEDFLNKADDGHTPKAALSTPHWRGVCGHMFDDKPKKSIAIADIFLFPPITGFPALAEPGSGTFDRTHQRDHGLARTDTGTTA